MFERLGVNKIIKTLVLADFLTISAWGFINPIFGVFVVEKIPGGSLTMVGTAWSIYWIVKSIFQVPISRYLDRSPSEADDFYSMIVGTFLVAMVPVGYIFVESSTHFYMLNIISAIGDAMAVPAWYAIFTRHIDKHKESFEWTLNSVSIGLGAAWSAYMAGRIADNFGFTPVFILTTIFIIGGGLTLLLLAKDLVPWRKRSVMGFVTSRLPERRDHKK